MLKAVVVFLLVLVGQIAPVAGDMARKEIIAAAVQPSEARLKRLALREFGRVRKLVVS